MAIRSSGMLVLNVVSKDGSSFGAEKRKARDAKNVVIYTSYE